jgi:uncharacterized protein YdeI (YjbR/CyaY-like superfamily)
MVDLETFYPKTIDNWRDWLHENHEKKQSIWLIYYKKNSKVPSITWSQAVDQALCFGWIDSTARPIDDEKYMQFFSKRKASSTWSKVNKEKLKVLFEANQMMPAGIAIIEEAKKKGSWTILDEVEEMIIPADLDAAFEKHEGSKDFFMTVPKSLRKAMLQWIVLAKQIDTRQKRINEIAEKAALKLKPKQF